MEIDNISKVELLIRERRSILLFLDQVHSFRDESVIIVESNEDGVKLKVEGAPTRELVKEIYTTMVKKAEAAVDKIDNELKLL